MTKVVSLLLIVVLFSVFYFVLFSPFRGGLPLTFTIAATIIVSVAMFGTIVSTCLRKRGKT